MTAVVPRKRKFGFFEDDKSPPSANPATTPSRTPAVATSTTAGAIISYTQGPTKKKMRVQLQSSPPTNMQALLRRTSDALTKARNPRQHNRGHGAIASENTESPADQLENGDDRASKRIRTTANALWTPVPAAPVSTLIPSPAPIVPAAPTYSVSTRSLAAALSMYPGAPDPVQFPAQAAAYLSEVQGLLSRPVRSPIDSSCSNSEVSLSCRDAINDYLYGGISLKDCLSGYNAHGSSAKATAAISKNILKFSPTWFAEQHTVLPLDGRNKAEKNRLKALGQGKANFPALSPDTTQDAAQPQNQPNPPQSVQSLTENSADISHSPGQVVVPASRKNGCGPVTVELLTRHLETLIPMYIDENGDSESRSGCDFANNIGSPGESNSGTGNPDDESIAMKDRSNENRDHGCDVYSEDGSEFDLGEECDFRNRIIEHDWKEHDAKEIPDDK